MKIKLGISLVLAFLAFIFISQNSETVTVAFLAWSVEMSLVLLVFIVLFTGIVIGWSLSSYLRFARHRAQNRQREKVTTEAMTKQKETDVAMQGEKQTDE